MPSCQDPRSAPALRAPLVALALALGFLGACGLIPEDPGSEEWNPPSAPATARALEPREPCDERDPLRRAFFGDLHVHTGFSMDARIRGTLLTPDDAYRYATGEPISVAPLDAQGVGTRSIQIDRPLDFAAVTDHAEWMGEVAVCIDPEQPTYDSSGCRIFRGEEESWIAWLFNVTGSHGRIVGVVGVGGRSSDVCGEDATVCRAGLASVWQRTQAAAERFYDRSPACRFTTFHGWEYSRSPGRSKIHRNVLFRNEIVPELPISWMDTPHERLLWKGLKEQCLDANVGCDVLTIPHNPNLSNGNMFQVPYRDEPLSEQRAQAELRASMEPALEIVQVKGESECASGMWGVVGDADELCSFEKVRGLGKTPPEDCFQGTGSGALKGKGCRSRLDFARYALLEGLIESQRIGVNPYKLGFVGGTDTHNASPGAVLEADYPGAGGREDETATLRLTMPRPGNGSSLGMIARNPGGLAGIWAEENSRDSLFDAMERRETFATSGPRIAPRFFGGWNLPTDLCDRADFAAVGYEHGVPMGADLPERGAAAPTFGVLATADAGSSAHPGGLLQRAQIVKGWVDADGRFHQKIYDVAGTADNGARVDLGTCERTGPGYRTLCGTWRDPEFDPTRPAIYYARILENPSCRWSWWQCLSFPAGERPEGCQDVSVPRTIQERAWTSPIWYEPAAALRPAVTTD